MTPKEGPQQENDDFDTVWVPMGEVVSTLSFDGDRQTRDVCSKPFGKP
jgi:hypothetical protein